MHDNSKYKNNIEHFVNNRVYARIQRQLCKLITISYKA